MTKYILLGGYVRKAPDGGKAFCEELVRGFEDPVKILDCMFAESEEHWDAKFTADKELFATHLPGKKINLQLADLSKFVEQVKWADAIFLRGGNPELLISRLKQTGKWEKELDGKTLAGTSAGAYAISKYYHGLAELKMGEGFGFTQLKVIAHWRSDYNAPNVDWDKAYVELQAYKEDLPILTLSEGEFKVIVV